ncbi:Ig-like domain-containing protein [Listeria ivanovii]|uniref:Ig-like domain-containing protein n=2 Tax=Listeria ivanovii TaxID=1638 RepID=UPI00209BCE50|nr:Ig-like domain-containing protein [Listeria ivanovii]
MPHILLVMTENIQTVKLTWELPTYTNKLSYEFSKIISIGKTIAVFDGTVIQRLFSETAVNENVTTNNQILPESSLAEALKKA